MEKRVAIRASSAWVAVWLLVCLVAAASEPDPSLQVSDTPAAAIRVLLAEGRFSEAEADARRLLPLSEEGPLDQSMDSDLADLLVETLVRNGRGAVPRTRELAAYIVRARTSRLGPTDPSLAVSIRNLSETLFESGLYADALTQIRLVVAMRERTPASSSSDVADDLDLLTKALTELGQYDDALAVSARALSVREQRDAGDNAVGLARTLRLRGVLQQRKSQFAQARASLERALAQLQAARPTHPETALALRVLGIQLTLEGDLTQGHEVLTRAVSLATSALPPTHPDLAYVLAGLAINLQELGNLSESRALRERAVEILEHAFPSDHPVVATRLNDLANVCLLQGEYVRAQGLYERAREIYRRRLGPDHPATSTAVFNLALVHGHLGDVREARRHLEAVIATWERVAGRDHPDVGRAVAVLAELLADNGFDIEAQPYFERAAAIREKTLGPNHTHLAWTLSERADSLARLGDRRKALPLAARAVRICEASGAQESLAAALNIHARILAASGDHGAAGHAYERSLDIRRKLLGTSHPKVADTEIALARQRAYLQDRQNAFSGALRGDAINRTHSRLTLASLSERQALDYAAERPRGLDLALSLMSGAQQAMQVLEAVVLGRALVLDELAARQRMLAAQKGVLGPFWSALASARQRYANLVIRGPNEQRLSQHAALVDDARRVKERAERMLAEQSAAFKSELKRTDVGLNEVRANLPPNTALISFVRFSRSIFDAKPTVATPVPSYVAFVLRPEEDAPHVVHLGRASALDALIKQWRHEVVTGITQPTATPAEAERALRPTGAALRRRLWDPIAVHLQGVKRVYIVPDGALNLVPLTALPSAPGRYLLDDGPIIHYLSAERDLVPGDQRQTGRGLLAIGGPAFADGSVFAARSGAPAGDPPVVRGKDPATANPASPAAPYRSAATECAGFRSLQFPALPGSRREVEEVARLWRATGAQEAGNQVLVGREATERSLKELAADRSILHLATHGFFLGNECGPAAEGTRSVGGLVTLAKPKPSPSTGARRHEPPENPLLLSGLALAGANRRAVAGQDEDDGILTAEEVASLDLQGTEWAVLSACDTGLGRITAGEGVVGLRRAFQVAGARTVIMSLWSVDDQATRLWMRTLYDGRLNKRLSTADAVRAASLAVLRASRARGESTHPFYWAAFVAAGDWR